jgi:archaellum component FlaC
MPKNFEKDAECDKIESPISELEEILHEAGKDIHDLFGVALTIFAGPAAASKDDKEKEAELEKMIFRN